MIAVDHHPRHPALIRWGWRMAAALKAMLSVVCVRQADAVPAGRRR